MSNVTLSIGGRQFTVACAEGEEDHVSQLGRMIDSKLTAMGDMAGQNEARMLLFAALLLADEVHEVQFRTPDRAAASLPAGTAQRLDTIAARLENLALSLERGPVSA
jgi:cell division protein ZapA